MKQSGGANDDLGSGSDGLEVLLPILLYDLVDTRDGCVLQKHNRRLFDDSGDPREETEDCCSGCLVAWILLPNSDFESLQDLPAELLQR